MDSLSLEKSTGKSSCISLSSREPAEATDRVPTAITATNQASTEPVAPLKVELSQSQTDIAAQSGPESMFGYAFCGDENSSSKEIIMEISVSPQPPFSRDPADTQNRVHSPPIDLSEDALLASDYEHTPTCDAPNLGATLTASMENLSIKPTIRRKPRRSYIRRRPRSYDRTSSSETASSQSSTHSPPPKRTTPPSQTARHSPTAKPTSPQPGPSQARSSWPSVTSSLAREGTSTSRGRGTTRGTGRGIVSGRGRGGRRRQEKVPAEVEDPARLPSETPPGFYHYLIDSHPWARYVNPRPVRFLRSPEVQVSTRMPMDVYEHLPPAGYLKLSFNRSLFPKITTLRDRPVAPVPVIEMQHLEDAIGFRQRSEHIRQLLFNGQYQDDDLENRQKTPEGQHPSTTTPTVINGRRPVLYQVVATGWGTGVVLEAKDFFTVGPDRRDLHCIILDQFAINVVNSCRGFDRNLISVKDFVWIYDVKPTRQALQDPKGTLARSRISRTTALDNNSVYFFRAAEFAFVTPDTLEELVYGLVLSKIRRRGRVTHLKVAFEGAPEAVTLTPLLCDFPLDSVKEDDFVLAVSRYNVSCAMRFSEPPASERARKELCHKIRDFLPMHPDEAVVPLKVYRATDEDKAWLTDRAESFNNYVKDPPTAKKRMAKVFNVACAALAAVNSVDDDRRTHWVTATVPNISTFPLSLHFVLTDMATEAGWVKRRPVVIWIDGSNSLVRATIRRSELWSDSKALRITLDAYAWSRVTLERAVLEHGRTMYDGHLIDICVRLTKPPVTASPVFECLSRQRALENLLEENVASAIMDRIYGATPLGCHRSRDPTVTEPVREDLVFSIGDRVISLSNEQRDAVALGISNAPVSAIQAAFGTGKTVVGAVIAARLAMAGTPVLVTASTNAAVAQFAQTVLSITEFSELDVLRYVSDVAAVENLTPTAVDMNKILMTLGEDFAERLNGEDRHTCAKFARGRAILERYIENPELALEMTEEEREEYAIAERHVSRTLARMIGLLFALRPPHILCVTTASLLNTFATPHGSFSKYSDRFRVIIGDEASQIPEPALAAIANRLPSVRQVYIGDIHQLEPYARCHRTAHPAMYGARSVMAVLWHAKAVPVAPLVRTFRAHPALNELPNRVAYNGSLVSGTTAAERSMLLEVIHFPTPTVPFMFINVNSRSQQAVSKSHFNWEEAEECVRLIRLLNSVGIQSSSICVIAFYREQYKRIEAQIEQLGAELSTVDSVQGREKDVVILLTTRTDFSSESADFLDDYRRMNVALSRCRHGQFVLGHAPSLAAVPFWGRVLAWARSLDAVVQSPDLSRYFTTD